MEKYKYIFGWLGLIISLLVVCVGLPKQIYDNYRNKSTAGLSKIFFIISGFSYLIWTLYAMSDNSWYIGIPNSVGVVFIHIVYFQMWYYRDSKLIVE